MWASIVGHGVAARLVKTLPLDSSVHARAETADRLSVGRCGGDVVARSACPILCRDAHQIGPRQIVRCRLWAQRDIWSGMGILHGLNQCPVSGKAVTAMYCVGERRE